MKILAASLRDEYAEAYSKLQVPPDPVAVAKLAGRYESPELGHIDVRQIGPDLVFDFGSFSSRMATKKNEDGTISFFMIDPGVTDMSFVAKPSGGQYALIMRDAQHEYAYRVANSELQGSGR